MIIVLTGIDGSGKTTAARSLVAAARAEGRNALLLSNYAGRRRMSLLGARFGMRLPDRLADAAETTMRVFNVLVSHARASRFEGLVVMDRHLHCQLALREVKDLPRGRILPWLLRTLPAPDLILHLDVGPEAAHRRIVARGTDEESVAELTALRAAYRALPEYADMVVIDAGGRPAEVLARVVGAVDSQRLLKV
ncbi:thymidylate kinase [Arthrobacter sp. NPDC057013]|uniref:thymidylate kinase n=1 Tax=Arthrobacter sp. NPDC057013 TaxID=3345999 RepID=UPI00363ADF47